LSTANVKDSGDPRIATWYLRNKDLSEIFTRLEQPQAVCNVTVDDSLFKKEWTFSMNSTVLAPLPDSLQLPKNAGPT
jgi:hypothetical protein